MAPRILEGPSSDEHSSLGCGCLNGSKHFRSRRHPVVQILLVVLASLTSTAAAEAPAKAGASTELPIVQPGVRLSWVRGPSAVGCPDASTIETDTVRRLGHNPFAGQPTSFIEALVTREMESYRVTILMRDAQGKLLGSRVLTSGASDCQTLATAAALTIAILIDPDAVARSSAEAPPKPPAGPPPALPSTDKAAADPPAGGRAGRATAMGIAGRGLLPRTALGAGLALTLDVGRYGAVGTIVGLFPDQRSRISGGDFGFGLSSAQFLGCFARSNPMIRWEVCAGGMVSALHVVVYAAVPEDPGEKWAVGVTAMARSIIKLVGPAVLEVSLSATDVWPRRTFVVAGRPPGADTVFTQGAVALAASIGVGVGWR